jgi:DNA (cytosine-5)-methyltransferase 1
MCGAGGAGEGYRRAGFDVIVGVDIASQKSYPFRFYRGDAIGVLERLLDEADAGWSIHEFDAVHASPPCQANSPLRHRWGKDGDYPELIPATRELLIRLGLPYVIENVPAAALVDPVTLCGSMFGCGATGRQLRRHRLFETTFPVPQPECRHVGQPVGVYGKGGGKGANRGYKGSAAEYREAMEMPWAASKLEIAQAIPPAYTEYIGRHLLASL